MAFSLLVLRKTSSQNFLDKWVLVGYTHFMTVITDSKKRVTLPAKPGSRFDVQSFGEDKYILTRLEKVTLPRARIIKRGGRLYLTNGRALTNTDVQKVLEEFP